MISDSLMLNYNRVEFLVLGIGQQLSKVNINSISVWSTDVCPAAVAKNQHCGLMI